MMDALEEIALEAYNHIIGLELRNVAVNCSITKAPCGGQKAGKRPVDRAKQGIKRSMAVVAEGIPIGVIAVPANRHDSPLLELQRFGGHFFAKTFAKEALPLVKYSSERRGPQLLGPPPLPIEGKR